MLLTGGPGEPGLWTFLSPRYVPVIEQLNDERDVILLDQRSTGGALPELACPEVVEAQLVVLAAANDPLTERTILEDAYRACFDRLRAEGTVDLDQYDTPDPRSAQGEPRAPPVGGARRRCAGVRRQPDPGRRGGGREARIRDAVRSLRRAVRLPRPRPDPEPPGVLGFVDGEQLEADLAQLQQFWNTYPYVTVYPYDGRPLTLTGGDAVWALFKAQYFTDFLQVVPTFIELLAPGDPFFGFPIPVPFDAYVQNLPLLLSIDRGTWATVNCADRFGIVEPTDLMEVWAAEPVYRSILVDSPTFPEICDEIVMVEANQPVFSKVLPRNVPTLVLVGENDPITPPAFGEQVAGLLGLSATFLLIPGIGHTAVANSGGCGERLVVDFVSDPTGDLDAGCAAP